MKILKKLLLICLICLCSMCLFTDFSSVKNENSAAAATVETYNFSNLIHINTAQTLGSANIIKNINNSVNGDYTIISNYAVSLSLNLFEYKFSFLYQNTNLEPFHISISQPKLEFNDNDPNTGSFIVKFADKDTTYHFKILGDNINIYTSSTLEDRYCKFRGINSMSLAINGISFDPTTKTLSYISNITHNFDNQSQDLYLKTESSGLFKFTFVKPLVNFYKETETIAKFSFVNKDSEITNESNWLPSERVYNSMTIKFFRNYSEENPLFFNINLNGFTYYFKMFLKDSLIHIQYIDENQSAENQVVDKNYLIYQGKLTNQKTFDITFNKTGRYEIEFYDLTYNTELSAEENLENKANYYKTSFYIYDKTKSAKDNIYIVSQSYENDTPIDYIVSNSADSTAATLNTDVRATIKNLNSLSVEDIQKITIDVEKYYFVGTGRAEITTYDYEKIKKSYETNTDFFVDLTDDARYNIKIYYDNKKNPFLTSTYHIVKLPKTSFQVDEDSEAFTQTELYTKTEIEYTIPLYSQIKLNFAYYDYNNKSCEEESTFDKVYLNKFSVFYGIQSISINRYTRMVNEGGEAKPASTLDIEIKGVGYVDVTVIVNGTKTTYHFNEKQTKTLSFSDFGEYTFHVVDEMGTTASLSVSYQKQMNASSILLIVLSSIVVLAVVIFIVLARTKVSTR